MNTILWKSTDDDKYISYSKNLPSGIAHVPRVEQKVKNINGKEKIIRMGLSKNVPVLIIETSGAALPNDHMLSIWHQTTFFLYSFQLIICGHMS